MAKAFTRITNVGKEKSEKKPNNEFAPVQKKYSCCLNNKTTTGFVVLNNFRHVWTDVWFGRS